VTRRSVAYGDFFLDKAKGSYPLARDHDYSGPTFQEFMQGPVLAAQIRFERGWDDLPSDTGSSVRVAFVPPSPVFGPVVFYGYLVAPDRVEIADFADDPEYWTTIEGDPED
jgi:hypothetical protein